MAFDSAMALYCRSSQYGHALLTCETLFSLDMDPAGPPTTADRENGRALIRTQTRGAQSAKSRNPGKGVKSAPAPEPDGKKTGPADGQPAARETVDAKPGSDDRNRGRPTPMQLRTFHPGQIGEMRARVRTALSITGGDLPAFLAEPVAIPLKIGTREDLAARFGLPEDPAAPERRALNKVLGRYCRSFQYQHAILGNETRFSIDMKPDDPITDKDRHNAIQQLRHLSKLRMARKEREQRNGQEP